MNRKLFFDTPAGHWEEGLPIGNGFLGAVLMGGTESETIYLNEDSLYAGEPGDTSNTAVQTALAEVRRLLFAGEYSAAQALCEEKMQGPYTMPYEPLGSLHLTFMEHENITDYRRSLDLNDAIARVSYNAGSTAFRREVFASYPHRTICFRFESDQPTLSMRLRVESELLHRVEASEHQITLRGRCPYFARTQIGPEEILFDENRGIAFTAMVAVSVEEGACHAEDNSLVVTRARAVTLRFVAVSTHYAKDPDSVCEQRLRVTDSLPWDALKKNM